MSPKVSSSSVHGAGHAQEIKAPQLLAEMGKAGLLTSEIKSWLKTKHPELSKTIANIDTTGGNPPPTDPWANYPAGTRYAVIDKNEL